MLWIYGASFHFLGLFRYDHFQVWSCARRCLEHIDLGLRRLADNRVIALVIGIFFIPRNPVCDFGFNIGRHFFSFKDGPLKVS